MEMEMETETENKRTSINKRTNDKKDTNQKDVNVAHYNKFVEIHPQKQIFLYSQEFPSKDGLLSISYSPCYTVAYVPPYLRREMNDT